MIFEEGGEIRRLPASTEIPLKCCYLMGGLQLFYFSFMFRY